MKSEQGAEPSGLVSEFKNKVGEGAANFANSLKNQILVQGVISVRYRLKHCCRLVG